MNILAQLDDTIARLTKATGLLSASDAFAEPIKHEIERLNKARKLLAESSTFSQPSKRGGARPGAGRKKKVVDVIPNADVPAQVAATARRRVAMTPDAPHPYA